MVGRGPVSCFGSAQARHAAGQDDRQDGRSDQHGGQTRHPQTGPRAVESLREGECGTDPDDGDARDYVRDPHRDTCLRITC